MNTKGSNEDRRGLPTAHKATSNSTNNTNHAYLSGFASQKLTQ